MEIRRPRSSVLTSIVQSNASRPGVSHHGRSWRSLPFAAKTFISLIVLAGICTLVYHDRVTNLMIGNHPLLLCLSACVYFIANAGSIAAVISLTEGRPLRSILVDCYFWSFPYYLVGAGIAGAIAWLNHTFNWETS